MLERIPVLLLFIFWCFRLADLSMTPLNYCEAVLHTFNSAELFDCGEFKCAAISFPQGVQKLYVYGEYDDNNNPVAFPSVSRSCWLCIAPAHNVRQVVEAFLPADPATNLSVEQFYAGHSDVQTVSAHAFDSHRQSLRLVDLSYNRISNITDLLISLKKLPFLTELRLNGNPVEALPSDFVSLNIQTLVLHGTTLANSLLPASLLPRSLQTVVVHQRGSRHHQRTRVKSRDVVRTGDVLSSHSSLTKWKSRYRYTSQRVSHRSRVSEKFVCNCSTKDVVLTRFQGVRNPYFKYQTHCRAVLTRHKSVVYYVTAHEQVCTDPNSGMIGISAVFHPNPVHSQTIENDLISPLDLYTDKVYCIVAISIMGIIICYVFYRREKLNLRSKSNIYVVTHTENNTKSKSVTGSHPLWTQKSSS